MNAWRRRFTRRVLTFAALVQVPSTIWLATRWSQKMPLVAAWACALGAMLLVNAPLVRRLFSWTDRRRASWARTWLFEVPFTMHLLAALVAAPATVLVWVALLCWPGHFRLWPTAHAALYLAGLAIAAYAVFVRRFWIVTRRVDVEIPSLREDLDGYTLVHLSDLHCGPHLPSWFRRHIVRRVERLEADTVVVTGDWISEGPAHLSDVTGLVRGLRARDGVFASLGNHDYYGLDGDEVADAIGAGGAVVLRNEGRVLRDGIYLAGADDSWSGRADLDRTLAARPEGAPCVLLWHDAGHLPDDAHERAHLILAGHTHGGQFAVPFFGERWNFARLRGRYSSGAYRLGDAKLYVHRGNGVSGPPARFGVAPEIVVFALRSPRRPRT